MSIQIDLKGKTALLTGGGRGLGKAIAEVLAKAGANVFIGNRKEAEGESVVEELRKLGVKADFKKVDVSVDAEVEEFFRAGEAFAGGKSILSSTTPGSSRRFLFWSWTERAPKESTTSTSSDSPTWCVAL